MAREDADTGKVFPARESGDRPEAIAWHRGGQWCSGWLPFLIVRYFPTLSILSCLPLPLVDPWINMSETRNSKEIADNGAEIH